MRWLLPCGFGLLTAAILGCGASSHDPSGTAISTAFERHKAVFNQVAAAEELTLYEGLPHQMFEAEDLKKERKDKPTVEFHGFPFYREPLPVSAEDHKQLQTILGSPASFESWRGERKCGGFHPDYLAEWKVGSGVCQVLICLGCEEVKVYGQTRSLYCYMKGDTITKLRDLLTKYRKNRPPGQTP